MNDPFKCKGCGAPRSYINQYCPICESSGPHIPVDRKTTRIRPSKHKAGADEPWWKDDSLYEKPAAKKRKEKPEKEEKRPPRLERIERKAVKSPDSDDKEMRSLWEEEKPRKPVKISISKKNWAYILSGAAVVLVVLVLGLNINFISQQAGSAVSGIFASNPGPQSPASGNQSSSSNTTAAASQPAPTTPTTSANNTATKPAAANPEPAKDIEKPSMLEKPSAQASDTTVTISWKTDEKSTSLVKYGTDKSYPFPSMDDTQLVKMHSIFLSGLTPDTTYYYQVISGDAAGNTLTASGFTFKTEPLTNAAPYVGSPAPAFTLKAMDGSTVSLSQFRGKKVILNFWASWCSPCKVELPHLQAVWEKYKDNEDFMLVTVAGSQSEEDALRSHVQANGFTFLVLLDTSDAVFNKYEIVSIPKTYFIDKSGTIRRLQQGMFTSPGEVEYMLNSY